MPDGISVSPETLREKSNAILAIDEKLDAASGSEAAGKRALANSLATENEAMWKKVADNLVTNLSKIEDPSAMVGAFTGVVKSLNDKFKTAADEYLAKEVANRQTDVVTISDEEMATLNSERKNLVDQFKALKNILDMFDQDVSDIPEPKKRTGSRGKRGPRVLTGFDFYIDGKARSASQNSLSSIANTVCTELNWKTSDLRNFLTEKGIDLQNPGEGFEVELPTDPAVTLKAVKGEPQAADEEEDDETDDEETVETEE